MKVERSLESNISESKNGSTFPIGTGDSKFLCMVASLDDLMRKNCYCDMVVYKKEKRRRPGRVDV